MRAYHIDRAGKLKEDMTIEFIKDGFHCGQNEILSRYPEGLSEHGKRYFASNIPPYAVKEAFIEYIFEHERLLHFPHLPSRYQSFFALEKPEDVLKWYWKLCDKELYKQCTVWEIEFDHNNYIKADASLLTLSSVSQAVHHAKCYWSGMENPNKDSEWELVIKLPVKIVRRISL